MVKILRSDGSWSDGIVKSVSETEILVSFLHYKKLDDGTTVTQLGEKPILRQSLATQIQKRQPNKSDVGPYAFCFFKYVHFPRAEEKCFSLIA